MASIALYYPSARFRDDKWLKLAMLTWDNVARIRPPGISDSDSEFVRRVCGETDFIIDVSPDGEELQQVSESFLKLLNAYQNQLHAAYASSATQSPTWIYVGGAAGGKVNRYLADRLRDAGLAVNDPARPYLGFHPKLGSIYMAVLAEVIAARNRLCPTTDEPRAYSAIGASDRLMTLALDDDQVRLAPDPESAYLQFAIQSVIVPNRLEAVPTATLIDFQRRHRAELHAFRAHIAELADELEAVAATANRKVAYAHLKNIYDTRTKPQLDDLRRGLGRLGVETTVGTLALKVDVNTAAGTLVGGVAATGGHWVLGGAAVAIAAIPYLVGQFGKRREQVKKSPTTYLLQVQKELNSRSLLRSLKHSS